MKLELMITKGKRIRNNQMFVTDESGFYRKTNETKQHHGKVPEIEDFVNFWGEIWEKEKLTPDQPWMSEVREKLKEKIHSVQEFEIIEENLSMVIKRRKNWSAPGVDGIQNYFWKRFKGAWKVLCKVMSGWKKDVKTIPEWLSWGRTVTLPKTEDLSPVKDYRPITCLNTSYKIYTGMLAKYMKEHAMRNNVWDEGQLGAIDGVLGTVDQLLIDKCIADEVREHKRNLAVAFYDYTKAYDRVHHDWMLRVYRWIGIPENVIRIISQLMKNWKTRLEVYDGKQRHVSRWISIACGFLQGDSYSPIGFCLSEVPVCLMLNESRGYRMGPPGQRLVKRTHSLFIDDLKTYQESHELLCAVNEMLVKASKDTGACYGVNKCAEMVFQRGRMVLAEGLEVLQEKMRSLDPDQNETYKFLGIEQGKKIDKEKAFERVTTEMEKRLKSLTELELYDKNLIRAINCRVIPVAAYTMNVIRFSKAELNEFDMIVKRELRNKNMLGRLSSDERLYMSRKLGGRGLISFRDVYKKTKVRVATYMAKSPSVCISEAWKRECRSEYCSIKRLRIH